LYFFKSRGYINLDGVDLSAEQVRIAQAVVPGVVEGDGIAFLTARPATYDLITALDVIEHLTKSEVFAFLDACRCALRPGGRLILQTPNGDSPLIGSIRYGDFTHETCFNPHSLGWLLGLCGFSGVEARECGPRPTGVKSTVRVLLWNLLHAGIRAYNLVEMGSSGSRVYTRVFLISGTVP
jgi:SAM-dependent methyltransferase